MSADLDTCIGIFETVKFSAHVKCQNRQLLSDIILSPTIQKLLLTEQTGNYPDGNWLQLVSITHPCYSV